MSSALTDSLTRLHVIRRLRNLIGPARRRFFQDDFNWDTYTADKYGPQQDLLAERYDLQIDHRVQFNRSTGCLETGTARLIPNSHTIYEIVGRLAVQSVLEIGCGGGDHLRNLSLLYPELSIRGGDRSSEQLQFLAARNPEIAQFTFQQDITMPLSSAWPRAELVYSQAVVMHIKTAVSHLNALANMFHLADKYVVLMENFGCHHFVNDITMLQTGGYIHWPSVHFYVHHYNGSPFGLIVAREPQPLPLLEDYFDLPHARKVRY